MDTLVFIRDVEYWFSSVLHVMPGCNAWLFGDKEGLITSSLLINKYTTLLEHYQVAHSKLTHKTENTGRFFLFAHPASRRIYPN